MEKINWYAGHMAKTITQIEQKIKKIDLIIQILDARCINISSNSDLISICKHKPLINIALKSDLADLQSKNNNVYYLNIKQKNFVSIVEKIINNKLANQISKLKSKGLVNPNFYCIVVGLPNVGKSSFINAFAKKKKVIVQNQPGITKKVNLVKINEYCSIYDTPGVFIKNVKKTSDNYVLGLIGSINKKILPIEETIKFAFEFYIKYYPNELKDYFDINCKFNFQEFVEFIINKYKFIGKEKSKDYAKAYNFLFNIFANNKICKVNYEK